MKPANAWPQARIERLRELWIAGIQTKEIAHQMGTTKGSICGMARRQGLEQRQPGKDSPARKQRLPGLTLFELKPGSCRWPNGDPRTETFRFCGAAKASKDGPYCKEHSRKAKASHQQAPRYP